MKNIEKEIQDLVCENFSDKGAKAVNFSKLESEVLNQMPQRWKHAFEFGKTNAEIIDVVWEPMKSKLPGFISELRSRVLVIDILLIPDSKPAILYIFTSDGKYYGFVGWQPAQHLPEKVAGVDVGLKSMWCGVHDGWTELGDSDTLLIPSGEWREIGKSSDVKLTELFRRNTNTIGVCVSENPPRVYGIYVNDGEVEEIGGMEKFWPEIDMWLCALTEEFDNNTKT